MSWGEKYNQVRERLLELFPVRQVYFRTNGIVRFISIPSWLQMLMLGILTITMLWVIITSFHYLSRDLILERKDEAIKSMEVQVDHISGDMSLLQRNILERTRQLEERQLYLEALLEQDPIDPILSPASNNLEMGPFLPLQNPDAEQSGDAEDIQSSLLPVDEMKTLAEQRFETIEIGQQKVALSIMGRIKENMNTLDTMIEATGLTSSDLLAKWDDSDNQNIETNNHAMGGPFVPTLNIASPNEGELSGDPFQQTMIDLNQQWVDMSNAFVALDSVPSIEPAGNYYISSRFGPRTDPIRKVAAVHYALDMAGPAGTSLFATAKGRAVKARNWGPYGNMVEIDHGNGFKTRYGHMQAITIKEGQMVEVGQEIGKMGCTGRCTSTHVHYEVWFGDRPRDPTPFLRVSENVLVNERRNNE